MTADEAFKALAEAIEAEYVGMDELPDCESIALARRQYDACVISERARRDYASRNRGIFKQAVQF